MGRYRRLYIAITLLVCLISLAIGYIMMLYGSVESEQYNQFAAVMGGVASIMGLASLIRPPITPNDIEELDVASIKRLTRSAEELADMRGKRSAAEEEIAKLEEQRTEMEIIVKKASMSVFLVERLSRYESLIIDILDDNDELRSYIYEYRKTKDRLDALSEEIESNENIEIINAVIDDFGAHNMSRDSVLNRIVSFIDEL